MTDRTEVHDIVRAHLPLHLPAALAPAPLRLRVDGLVRRVLDLGAAELATMTQAELTDDFRCLEGWRVPQVAWQGVSLRTVFELVGVLPEAQWLQASAGRFSVPLSLVVVTSGLLALRLEQAPIPAEHGGPIRLVVPGQACFTSVKWLDHLELRASPAPNTAEETALDRLIRT